MQIIEHLESMWASKISRKTPTIPEVSYDTELSVGSLNNDDWFFKVPYAFRAVSYTHLTLPTKA